MKASLKFREEQKPLFRAKLPLSIMGLSFQSGIVAGEDKELSLNLSTFFESGPSFKVAYRPNDSQNPFSLVLKTGTGPFGSPSAASPLVMSAEFNFVGSGNPSFMLHLKPRFGDFSIKKSQTSSYLEKWQNGVVSKKCSETEEDRSVVVVEKPVFNGIGAGGGVEIGGGGLGFNAKKLTSLPPPTSNALAAGLSGVEVTAITSFPLRSHALMSFRWGLRVPAEGLDSMAAAINFKKMPFLVMNKIGIEHVYQSDTKSEKATAAAKAKDEVAETCLAVKQQLDTLQFENSQLRKAMDDLRQEFSSTKYLLPPSAPESSFSRYRESDRNRARNSSGKRNEKSGSSVEENVSEELKKALQGASAGVSGA
uniref:Uncharacterized protein n=1 Tax=Linum usitatissimum TaxID=4006 RepID=I6XCP9_LINUS|nr:hypothetical protein [Linum usitatissimum]